MNFEFISTDLHMNVAFSCFNSSQAIRQQELYKRKNELRVNSIRLITTIMSFSTEKKKPKKRTRRPMKIKERRQNYELTKNIRLSEKQIYHD